MRIRSFGLLIRSLESDNLLFWVAIRFLELDSLFSRLAIRSLSFNIQQFEGEVTAIRENVLMKSRERLLD